MCRYLWLAKTSLMLKKESLINYIRENDPYYKGINLDTYTLETLVLIKVRLELENLQSTTSLKNT